MDVQPMDFIANISQKTKKYMRSSVCKRTGNGQLNNPWDVTLSSMHPKLTFVIK